MMTVRELDQLETLLYRFGQVTSRPEIVKAVRTEVNRARKRRERRGW